MDEYDVIVVGLGCAGISTAYYCAKKGLKVLGIEQFPCPGTFGSSSFGETRQWNAMHASEFNNSMMFKAVKMWKEIEDESGEKLIHSLPFLCMGTLENKSFKDIVDFHPKINLLNATQICEKFPGLKNIPSEYKGILTMDGGVIHAKKALNVCRNLAEMKYGAKLLFNTKVSKFSKSQVETTDGTTYTAKHVVMTCGVYSVNYTTCLENHFNKDLGYAVFSDPSGLPSGLIEYDHKGYKYYGLLDGDNLERYKLGVSGQATIDKIVEYYENRIPEKIDLVQYLQLCRDCYTESGSFQYKTDENGVHFAYGFQGMGFKFFPIHGKIIHDGLLNKLDETYVPLRYRSKI